jgi:predicted permease
VALSFVLLAGAGLFVKSLQNLKATSTGFEQIDNLLTFQLNPRLNGYSPERTKQLYTELLARLRATPGIKAASTASVPLLHGFEWDSSMSVEGHVAQDGEDIQAFMNSLSPGYWQTMGIEILTGRDFNESDRGEEFRTAIVNRHFAEHYFKTPENAVGRRIGFGGGPNTQLKMQIVGVVENSLYEGPRQGIHRQAFVPVLEDLRPGGAAFYVRATQSTGAIAPILRQRVRELDPALPLYELKTLDHQLDETLTTERFVATLSSAFGALATVLAAVGLYGVMAFVVTRRTKEIGLRMALGAKQSAVAWMVMREVLLLLGLGLAVSIPVAYVLLRYVSSVLFGVEPADLTSASAALALLAAVTVAAGLIPAVRASSIDPMRALRYE